MQTIYDSWVLGLVLVQSFKEFMGPRSYRGLRFIIASHGLVYFVYAIISLNLRVPWLTSRFRVVFSANLCWALMVLLATVSCHPLE